MGLSIELIRAILILAHLANEVVATFECTYLSSLNTIFPVKINAIGH